MAQAGSGIPLDALNYAKYTGTTCATANTTSAKKIVMPNCYSSGAYDVKVDISGQGTYLYGADYARDGINFPVAVVAGPAVNPAYLVGCMLTPTLYVYAYDDGADGTDGKCFAVSTSGNTPTVGTAAEFEDGGATDPALIRLSDTTFALAYIDSGDTYLKCVIGTVAGTTITYGTIKSTDLAATATAAAAGVGICEPRSGVLFIAFQIASGTDGSTVCIPYTGTDTLGTVTSQVEFEQTAPIYISCCSYAPGYVVVVFGDAGDSNYIHAWACSVSAAGVVAFGTEKTLVTNAGTDIQVSSPETNNIVVSYIDSSSDASLVATTVNQASPAVVATAGSVITPFGAGTHTGVRHSMIDNTQGIVMGDDGTYLKAIRFSKAAAVLTADAVIDTAVEGRAATETEICCNTRGDCCIAYANSSNVIYTVVGSYSENRVVDVRSSSASATYQAWLFPQIKAQAATAI